jgi:XTP/dITP diphosphohydrolase/tetrapyrrole methylase family protein/MazG family protein
MSALEDLLRTVAKLRDPDGGCPWDIEQTHQSITDCLIDECCELLQTIDRLDMDHMEEELGDVLLQVIFHAQIAKENGHFDFESVCSVLNEKLIRRHPHVFGDLEGLETSDAVLDRWELIKSKEKKRGPKELGVFKDLPRQLPALMFAEDVHKQIKKKGLDGTSFYSVNGVSDIMERTDANPEKVGKLLFEMVAWCKDHDVELESSLRRYTQRIIDAIESKEGSP